MPSIDALLTQSQLRWSGHLVRMQDSRLPKQLFYGELTGGHPPSGRPKLRYKDTLKKALQQCDIDEKQWEFLSTNRSEWRQAIRKGTEAYENERQVSQGEKHAATKKIVSDSVAPVPWSHVTSVSDSPPLPYLGRVRVKAFRVWRFTGSCFWGDVVMVITPGWVSYSVWLRE
ncbi:hypothetical protein ACOMHN_037154 [Nucella lapillus]